MSLEIHRTALLKAVALLKASGAKFHVQYEGEEWGAVIAPPKPKRSAHVNIGISDYTRLIMEGLAIGDSVLVPMQNWPLDALHSSVANQAGRLFGPGAYISARVPTGIEVLRIS